MIRALADIGETLGVREGFEEELWAPDDGDKIAIVSFDSNQGITIDKKFEYNEEEYDDNDKTYLFFHAGGNASLAGGTHGIGGVSPFFINPSKIQESKIKSSSGFIECYNEEHSDNIVENLFEDFKKYKNSFEELEFDWVYINSYNNNDTGQYHKFYIDKYLKIPQNKEIDWIEGSCDLCNNKGELRDIRLPFYSIDVSNYNFGLAKNKVGNGKLKLCENCEIKVKAGWNHLNNIFENDYLLIPSRRYSVDKNAIKQFYKIAKEAQYDFEKLNNVVQDNKLYENLEFTFLITGIQQSKLNIYRSVDNYRLFAKQFENELLLDKEKLKYFPADKIDINIPKIDNFFDLERLLKYYFVDDNNYKLELYGNTFHFYHLYNSDLPDNVNNKFKHILYIYRDELFSFIYEQNINSLNIVSLNNIVENFIRYELRKKDTESRFNGGIVRNKIIEGLNYYYFLRYKIYGGYNMKSRLNELKKLFEVFGKSEKQEIKGIINADPELIYYIIGQFISIIDAFRYKENKNKIFGNFIESLNERSAKKRFPKDILQNQNYYIKQLNPKAKFVFDLLSQKLNNLFEDKDFSEVIISMISGYYSTDNILQTNKEEETDE